MKNIYIKKFFAGILVFGSYLFFNSGITSNDPEVFTGIIICLLLPAIVLGGVRLYIWIISYALLVLSIWYTTIVPQTYSNDGSCTGGIYCGMDGRPFTVLLLYFGLLIILGIWQLVTFVKQRKLKNNLVK